jgi:hypothetical protein
MDCFKTLAGFGPTIFCSGGGRNAHYAKQPGPKLEVIIMGTLLLNYNKSI